MIRIQAATLENLEDVEGCARQAYSKYIARMDREPAPMHADFADQISRGFVHIAFHSQQFMGYVVFYPDGDDLFLENVAVLPDQSGKGVGRALMRFAESVAQQQGLKGVTLYTNEAMVENLVMYPKLGYVETGRSVQDGFRRVFFRKAL